MYMSLVQLGVPRPRVDPEAGWAWAGMEDAILASRLADFVAGALRAEAGGVGRGEGFGGGPSPVRIGPTVGEEAGNGS